MTEDKQDLVKLADNLYIPENFEDDHRYFADPQKKKQYTGVTTILGVLNKPALVDWAARMAVEYVQEYIKVAEERELDYENFASEVLNHLPHWLEEAKTAHAKKRDEGAQKGTDTHALVEEYVNHCIKNYDGLAGSFAYAETFKPIEPFIQWADKENITFISAETPLVSEKLWVAGTADLIFEKDGKRYIGDIKTYKKMWDRTPFYQCAGYALMYEEMNCKTDVIPDEKDSDYQYEHHSGKIISGYCIINLPKERDFEEKHDIMWSFDTEGDTRAFLACVEIYRQNAKFVSPKVYNKKTKK